LSDTSKVARFSRANLAGLYELVVFPDADHLIPNEERAPVIDAFIEQVAFTPMEK